MIKRLVPLVLLVSLTACTPAEVRGWIKWHRVDPEAANEYLNRPEVQAQLPTAPAPSNSGSSESSNGRCVGFESLLDQYNPGWDVSRMSKIMYRESRCLPDVSNSCCTGLLQVHQMHLPNASCGAYSRSDLYDPSINVCMAAELYRQAGMSPWSR